MNTNQKAIQFCSIFFIAYFFCNIQAVNACESISSTQSLPRLALCEKVSQLDALFSNINDDQIPITIIGEYKQRRAILCEAVEKRSKLSVDACYAGSSYYKPLLEEKFEQMLRLILKMSKLVTAFTQSIKDSDAKLAQLDEYEIPEDQVEEYIAYKTQFYEKRKQEKRARAECLAIIKQTQREAQKVLECDPLLAILCSMYKYTDHTTVKIAPEKDWESLNSQAIKLQNKLDKIQRLIISSGYSFEVIQELFKLHCPTALSLPYE